MLKVIKEAGGLVAAAIVYTITFFLVFTLTLGALDAVFVRYVYSPADQAHHACLRHEPGGYVLYYPYNTDYYQAVAQYLTDDVPDNAFVLPWYKQVIRYWMP